MSVTNIKNKRVKKSGKRYAACPACGSTEFRLILDNKRAEEENAIMWITEVECAGCLIASDTDDGYEYDIICKIVDE